MKLIVGLGNPGKDYEKTRHNIGFRIVDRLVTELNGIFKPGKGRFLYAEGSQRSEKIIMLKPTTYMNLSGEAVGPALHFWKLEPPDLLVVADDLNLPFAKLRLRAKGSAGGQNGLKSVIQVLKSDEFARLRFGIGSPSAATHSDYVLNPFHKDEEAALPEALGRAVDACRLWASDGILAAMNKYN